MRCRLFPIAVGALLATVASPAAAQDSSFVLVERIAAVVGNTVIPQSRVEEEFNVYQQQGGQVPSDPQGLEMFKQEILRQLIDQELLIQAALRDTNVVVTPQEVQQEVDRAMQQVRGQFGSEFDFTRQLQAAGFGSIEEYRRWLSEQTARDLLRRKYIQMLREMGELAPLAPTEAELREYFEATRAQQPDRPATISFRQIVVRSQGDSAAVTAARALADSLVVELRENDADFGSLARAYSADPGSRDQDGNLGWVRRGRLVPAFERVAFTIAPGTISNPVLTVFGYHIILVDRRQPSEVMVRHILIAPEVTDADRAHASAIAAEVAAALRDGASYDSLATLHHDHAGQEQPLVEDFPEEQLPDEYKAQLEGVEPGAILGPITLDLGDGRPKYAVIIVEQRRAAGKFDFEDLRDQMRSRLGEQNAMDRLIRILRESTYVEVRM
jgi:peptidyl-prolyl cis-trans isomerase SurA